MNRVGEEIVSTIEENGQFAVLIEDEVVPLLSLSPGALGKIQERTGLRWMQIILEPMARVDAAELLVVACAEKVGKPAPPITDMASLVRLFVEVPNDVPEIPQGDGANPTSAS